MTDFEDRFKALLNEHVDARTGPQRPAPPRRHDAAPLSSTNRLRTRWLPPLLAAAVIVVAVSGSVAGVQLLSSSGHPAGPATERPAPSTSSAVSSPSSPSSSPTPSLPASNAGTPPTSRRTPAVTRSTASTPPTRGATSGKSGPATSAPRGHDVTFGKATIALPAGWESRDLARYFPGSHGPPARCLTPASTPVNGGDSCPITLTDLGSDTASLYPDHDGGGLTSAAWCGRRQKSVATQSGQRQLGGRRSVWHHWDYDCIGRPDVQVEQYVAATAPAYVFYSSHADKATVTVMATIAAQSQLPG